MNKAIADNKKYWKRKRLRKPALPSLQKDNNRADYAKVVGEIDAIIEKKATLFFINSLASMKF